MVLRNVLDFLVPLLWVCTVLGFAFFIWRVGRRRGIFVALRQLLSTRALAPLGALIAITVLSASMVFIDPREVGVVVSLFSPHGVRETALRPGLAFIVPLAENVVRYPTIKQSYTMSGRTYEGTEVGDDSIRARTADGQLVIIDVTVVFQVDPAGAVKLHREWQSRYVEDFIRPGLRAFVRSQASRFSVDDINSHKRKAFESALNELIKAHTSDSGLLPDVILVRNITFSKEYAVSVEEKMMAKQRIEEAKFKADQIANLAKGGAEKIRIRAKADADAIREIAAAQASAHVVKAKAEAEALELIATALDQRDNLLTYRYIDKLAPNITAMLLPNDAPLILPMPQLGRNANAPGSPANVQPAGQAAEPMVAESVADKDQQLAQQATPSKATPSKATPSKAAAKPVNNKQSQ